MPLRGFKRLDKRLQDINIVGALIPRMVDNAELLKENIEEEAPFITGELRDSFVVVIQEDFRGARATIESDSPYYQFVVRGTSRQPANNFVERAANRTREELIDNIIQDATNHLDDTIRGK